QILHLSGSKVVVAAINLPRTARNFIKLDEPPVAGPPARESKIVAHGRGQIDARAAIAAGRGPRVAENIFGVGREKRTAVTPLREARALAVTDRHPPILADGLAVS